MSESVVMSPMKWAGVPVIDDVQDFTDSDAACLREIREVLVRHGAIERFGVQLIHKHFEMSEDEILVEYTDMEERTQTSRVEKAKDLPSEVKRIETQWLFMRENAHAVCHGYCYVNSGHSRRHQSR